MKIKKENKLVESKLINEAAEDAEKVEQELTNGDGAEAVLDAGSASTKEIAAQIADGAADQGVSIDKSKAMQAAQEVKQFVRDPYNQKGGKYYCAGNPGKIKEALQLCLDSAVDNGDSGFDSDSYPNLIIEGLAGFGKTAIVKSFCKEHGCNLFEVDAKTLDSATVGGIPYPSTDTETGETTQSPIASKFWKNLEKPYTILFLDELNRAHTSIRGTLLSLINNHTLPAFFTDEKGETRETKYYPNILFTVVAINPASDIFPDVNTLDPAEVSRLGVITQEPNKREYKAHLKAVYKAIIDNPLLDVKLRDKYEGQWNLAEAILSSSSFEFEDANAVRANYRETERTGHTINYLNYRSFLQFLKMCDGTKAGFLRVIKLLSGFSDTVKRMFVSVLSTYSDKPLTGNKVFVGNQQAAQQNVVKDNQQVQDILSAFAADLKI